MDNLNNWTFIGVAYLIPLLLIGGYIAWARSECQRLEKVLEAILEATLEATNENHDEVTNEPA